jgi:serine-type D-Ala-D-Ala carboxypeptidase/endopeptidase (penicillin-binding protein 4)
MDWANPVITRRAILGGLLAGVSAPALGEVLERSLVPPPRPTGGKTAVAATDPGRSARLVEAAKLGGSTGFVVMDSATGAVLEARAPDVPMPPASVAKAMTSLYALDRLGAQFRFPTRVMATGPIEAGMVQGDLILAGGGDPTLQTDQLGDLVARLAKLGLRGVTGRFVYWDTELPELPYVAADQPDHVGYNPAISGLNLNFNRVHFEWKRDGGGGWTVAVDARGERFLPQVDLVRVAVVERQTPLFTYEPGRNSEGWTVASAALGKGGSRWLPVRHPGLYTAEVFRTLSRAQGIRLPEPEPAKSVAGIAIGKIDSDPLSDVLRDMLKFSTNLTAEVVGLNASGAKDLMTSGAAMAAWANTTFGISARFDNHSGLGGQTRISPADMAKALMVADREGRGLKPLLRDYKMRDDAGKEIKGHPVKVLAKSGTLNFVSGLAGHIVPPGGRDLVFAIFSADPDRRDGIAVADREEPPGVKDWTRRARRLQGQLINGWAASYA